MPLMTATNPIHVNSLRGFAVELTATPTWVPDHIVPELIEAGGVVCAEKPKSVEEIPNEGPATPTTRIGRPRKTEA